MANRTRVLFFSSLALLHFGCDPNPPPGCDTGGPCPPGEVRTCLHQCAPQWDAADAAEASISCPLDPCDASSILLPTDCEDPSACEPVALCPEGWACRPTDGARDGIGQCVAAEGRVLVSRCAIPEFGFDEGEVCQAGRACVLDSCPGAEKAPVDRFCRVAVDEGQPCDSNVTEPGHPSLFDPGVPGCRPCTEGTYCVPTDGVLGRSGDPEPYRCARSCSSDADPFVPAPGRCACETSICASGTQSGRLSDGTDVGFFFCTPCGETGGACDTENQIACCDPLAVCAGDVCCRPPGEACEMGGTCCGDHSCRPDESGAPTCQPCAPAGSTGSNFPCCEGTVATQTSGGILCAACAVPGTPEGDAAVAELCSDASFVVETSAGAFDEVVVPDSGARFSAVVETSSGGDLDRSREDPFRAIYRLQPSQRAFLFDDPMEPPSRLRDGFWSVLLPQPDDPATPLDVVLTRDHAWQSVRVYDQGGCSKILEWDVLMVNMAVVLNREFALSAQVDELTIQNFQLDPRFAGTPQYPAIARGPQTVDDHMRVQLDVRGDFPGCGVRNADATVTAELRFELEPGFVATDPALDADMVGVFITPGRVGCAERGTHYECTLPVADDDGAITFESVVVPRFADTPWTRRDDATMEGVWCRTVRDVYECALPTEFIDGRSDPRERPSIAGCGELGAEGEAQCATGACIAGVGVPDRCCDRASGECDAPCDTRSCPDSHPVAGDLSETRCICVEPASEHPIRTETVRFDRPVRYVAGARDVAIRLSNLAVDIDDCSPFFERILERAFERTLRDRLRAPLADVSRQLAKIVDGVVGSDAITHHGIAAERLPACRTDLDCVDPTRGRRDLEQRRYAPVCDPSTRRCRTHTIEPRRLSYRPEGLEFVFSEGFDSADPQERLVQRYSTYVTSAPSDDGVRRRYLAASCDPDRNRATAEPHEQAVRTLSSAGSIYGGLTGRVCDAFSAEPCDGICYLVGIPCDERGVTLLYADIHRDDLGSTCVNGQCVD